MKAKFKFGDKVTWKEKKAVVVNDGTRPLGLIQPKEPDVVIVLIKNGRGGLTFCNNLTNHSLTVSKTVYASELKRGWKL